MKILHVDDEQDVLDQAEIFLRKNIEGLDNIITLTSAEKGLEILENRKIDTIVSDYKMPETDSIEFLKIVRREMESEIPFIIFTGKGGEEVAMKAPPGWYKE